MTARQAQSILVTALIAGLVVRLAFGLGYWVGKPLTHDEQEYLLLAGNVAAGRGFTYGDSGQTPGGEEHFGRTPLYPLFLVLVTGGQVFENGALPVAAPTSVKVAQAVVGTLSIWVLAAIAARSAGPGAGAVAAAIAAVYPPLAWMSGYVLSEALYTLLALSSALLLQIAVRSEGQGSNQMPLRYGLIGVAGLATGAATLTRPATLIFVGLVCFFLALRKRPGACLGFGLAVALTLVPWTAHNYREHGRLVVGSSEGGITFWTGNNALARGEGDMAANPEIKRANLEIRAQHPGMTPEELEPVYYREAFAFIRERPLAWLQLMARKAFYLVVPIGPSYTLHSARYFLASLVSYCLLLPLAALGFLRLRRQPVQPWGLWLLALSAVLVCLIFFPQERFRIPVLDPTLIICASVWAAGYTSGRRAPETESPRIGR